MSTRDDFTVKTKEIMAHRAGYRCSKPDCGIPTRGAASDDDKTINVGFAAHITAASSGGPRYNPALTKDQRRHHKNGIWLCGTHGKLVDSDESHFTVEELHKWKRLAERRSFLDVVSSKPSPLGARLADDDDYRTAFDLLLDYSKLDLSAFLNMPSWPAHAIALNLRMVDGESTQVFTASGLASGIDVFDEVAVIAPPGTGKTTTLLQLAEAILADAASVAVFVPLSEWSTRSDTFFQSLVRRAAFRDAKERQFELLAQQGKLVLILDGWNELDEASKRRVRNDTRSLRRDFPDIRLVVSSRHKDFDIPIDGPVVEMELMTEEQQLDIAKALRASEGESLMDHAWRTPGLRELVAIPLYLIALLKHVPGGSLPTTKEEVLRSFVSELEQDPDKLAIMREALQGFHRDFLVAIAVVATHHGTVALSNSQARAAVNTMQEKLKADNQIAQLLQPMNVLDALVSAHMLVRSGIESGGVSFQHQQFQEWFASFNVQQLMLSAASGDDDANKALREDLLDIPVWEESILFACERLSRADQDGINAVAHVILETLSIDPLLSAEIIWRSSDEVWEQIKDDVLSFAGTWHMAGRVDRAVRFMIDTGRAEFSNYVWPLISDQDNQVHLRALQAGRRFRPSVLGPGVQERIAALPEEIRGNVVSEIASNGGMDGIELATSLAKDDASARVQKSAIESLVFRRADRFAKEVLESAPDEVWRSLAEKWHHREFADPDVSARIKKEAAKLYAEETDPLRVLNTLLSTNVRDSETGLKVRELVEQIDHSEKSQDNRWAIHHAYEIYPKDVVAALVSLLQQDKSVPYLTEELLLTSDVIIDDGPLVERVLQNSGEGKTAATAVSIVGPKTVCQLIDQTFAMHARIWANNGGYDKDLSDEYHRLKDWISDTKVDVFIQAVLERANTEKPNEIAILADLISRHGGSAERGPLRLDAKDHERATAAVQGWAKILLGDPDASRAEFAEVAQAAERLESPQLVPVLQELLSEDLARRKRALEEFVDERKKGRQIQNDAHMSWTLQYRRAFAAIGDDQTVRAMIAYLPNPEFGLDGAHVLKAVWQKSQPRKDESGFMKSWPDFSVVPIEYAKRQTGTGGETHPFVNDIVAAIDDLIKPGAEDADFKHALNLATVAFNLPFTNKKNTISALLQLPVPTVNKRDLLTVLVLAGETISSEMVLLGIDELLEEAEANPWMLQEQDGWRLLEWLRLLPFTERPAAILDVLDRVEGFRPEPWNLRKLLSALRYAPSVEAETVLDELAKRDQRFLSEYEWLTALADRNTLTAARLLLDLICSGSFTEKAGRLDVMHFGKKISAVMASHDQFRKDVYGRYPRVADGPARSVLEYAIAEAADAQGVLLLTREGAAREKRLQSTVLHTALRHVLIGQTPIDSSGGHELYSLPTPELRRGLFDMVVNGNAAQSRLASECLTAIDEFRDDYGQVDTEPRHPDIAMGVSWPQIDVAGPG